MPPGTSASTVVAPGSDACALLDRQALESAGIVTEEGVNSSMYASNGGEEAEALAPRGQTELHICDAGFGAGLYVNRFAEEVDASAETEAQLSSAADPVVGGQRLPLDNGAEGGTVVTDSVQAASVHWVAGDRSVAIVIAYGDSSLSTVEVHSLLEALYRYATQHGWAD